MILSLLDTSSKGRFETDARKIVKMLHYNQDMFTSHSSAPVIIFLLLFCVAGVLRPSQADIYKYVDENGRMYFTDRPKHKGYRLILKSRKSWQEPKVDYQSMQANRKRFADKIASVARSYELPEGLMHAVIATESAYDPNAVSRAGAVGLMQLMPDTARQYGVSNRHDPAENMSAGARYLKDLLKRFGNNLELALAGYNAGGGAVEKFGNKIPPFSETQTYVRKVIKLYEEYPKKSASDA